jgi:hypothetical protein
MAIHLAKESTLDDCARLRAFNLEQQSRMDRATQDLCRLIDAFEPIIQQESNARINRAARNHPSLEDRRMMKNTQSPLRLNELLGRLP